MHLTRVGIGKLIVADFDVVQESNLNRQFYFKHQLGAKKVDALKTNLLAINPELNIEIHDIRLDAQSIPQLYKSVDVMVEAFDKAEMKELIAEVFQAQFSNIPLVMGMEWPDGANQMKLRFTGMVIFTSAAMGFRKLRIASPLISSRWDMRGHAGKCGLGNPS